MKMKLKTALKQLALALAEFFNPRDWIPTFPIVRKHDPDALGYQTLGEAIRGFPKKDE